MTGEPEPAFTPEEEAHYERRKAEAETPLTKRVPPRTRWLVGTLVGLAIVVGVYFYLMR